MSKSTYSILSCDGGGIRGLITAKILQALHPSVLKNFDLFAGTSTGSIIAVGLASGVPIETIVELYSSEECCSTVFRPYLSSAEQKKLANGFATAGGNILDSDEVGLKESEGLLRESGPVLLFPKYRSDGLRHLLARYLPDMTLTDVWTEKNKAVVVPSFQLSADVFGQRQWLARLFNNLPAVSWMPEAKVIDIILASAAAPVYFPPHEVPRTPGGNAFIDGGVFANNPSTSALSAFIGSRIPEQRNIPLSRVFLLSVGTGFTASSYPPPDALFPYGVLGWLRPQQHDGAPAFPLVGTVFDGTSQINDFTSRLILGADNHIRVDPRLNQPFSMDDCDAIPKMLEATEDFLASDEWKEQSESINELFGDMS